MTDHKAEAEEWAQKAISPDATKTLTYAALAQASATLYLAEQQRIANLIALADLEWESNEQAAEAYRQIKEGLGL